MKPTISLLLTFFCTFIANVFVMTAQDGFICATPEPDPDPPGVYTYSDDPDYLASFEPVVFNIFFWQINDPNGNSRSPLTEQLVLETVAKMNLAMNPLKIYFKYRGFDSFDSPSNLQLKLRDSLNQCPLQFDGNGNPIIDTDGYEITNNCQYGDLKLYADSHGYRKTDAFNIYVPSICEGFGGVSFSRTSFMVPTYNLLEPTLLHELGHNLGLAHTFAGWYNPNAEEYPDPDYTLCEHVTRDESNINFNAYARGDRFADTGAMPDFISEYCIVYGYPVTDCYGTDNNPLSYFFIDRDECVYTPGNKDCLGVPYDISENDVRNYMAYSPHGCADRFSTAQGIKMHEVIQYNFESVYQYVDTEISALYEPYKGEYYVIGPQSTSVNPPLFQPGFDYRFVECCCNYPEPSEYGDISFSYTNNSLLTISKYEKNYSIITHPNHSAIQLDIPMPDNGQNTRRCYDNWNRKASGGQVTQFNDGVFNTNVTITPKDSLGINDQNLVTDLPQGLYEIEKNFDDGASQETVIYKGN